MTGNFGKIGESFYLFQNQREEIPLMLIWAQKQALSCSISEAVHLTLDPLGLISEVILDSLELSAFLFDMHINSHKVVAQSEVIALNEEHGVNKYDEQLL